MAILQDFRCDYPPEGRFSRYSAARQDSSKYIWNHRRKDLKLLDAASCIQVAAKTGRLHPAASFLHARSSINDYSQTFNF